MFHISLLELAAPDAALQTEPPLIDPDYEEPVYTVDKIIDDAWVDGQQKYLVRWKGYSHTETTWETEDSFMTEAPIRRYLQRHRRTPNHRTRNPTRDRRPSRRLREALEEDFPE